MNIKVKIKTDTKYNMQRRYVTQLIAISKDHSINNVLLWSSEITCSTLNNASVYQTNPNLIIPGGPKKVIPQF